MTELIPATAEKSTQPRATLHQFVEDNSKLITSTAAFVALTAFSAQVDDTGIKIALGCATFLGAFLLSFELMMRVPPPPRQWRLEAFQLILMTLPAFMGWYWFTKFQEFWVPLVFSVVEGILVLLICVLATYVFTKCVQVSARLLRRKMEPSVLRRVSQIGFVLSTILFFVAWIWIMHRFGGRQFKLHVPF
jgi:hypothetical protein